MMLSAFYLILAILGLGFLIFIHELGHLFMARRVGMKVEIFSIGFGPVIRSGVFKNINWQLCLLPFGGYVRIAGMERQDGLDSHQSPDGFYAKTPLQRIKVAAAGPTCNIIFSLFVFCCIWLLGGQQKPFQQYTQIIGYVDPHSQLYLNGVRAGDEILSVGGKKVEGYQNLLVSMLLSSNQVVLEGIKNDYPNSTQENFKVNLPTSQSPQALVEQLGAIPAQYLIFNDFSSPDSPLRSSGIQKGDQIVWVDGHFIFSYQQLSQVLNEPKAVLTVQRNQEIFLTQIPRLKIADLRLRPDQKNEIDDWHHEAALSTRVDQLYFIPYLISYDNVIVKPLSFMDFNAEETQPIPEFRHPLKTVLQPGDKIIEVDGAPVINSIDFIKQLQSRNALMVVYRGGKTKLSSWTQADSAYKVPFELFNLQHMVQSIHNTQFPTQKDQLVLLKPITLKPLSELKLDPERSKQLEHEYLEKKKLIEKIENYNEREEQLYYLEQSQNRLMLGANLVDRFVSYNPSPFSLVCKVFDQTWQTLTSLFSGSLSPKTLTGPVGIVQALQYSWASGLKDALFWLGFVSLNLSILNFLPIPVLDGGHILFAVIEAVIRRPIKAKTMEKVIVPFMVLLLVLFIYLTYHDISKLISRFF